MENSEDEAVAGDGDGWMGSAGAYVVLVGPSLLEVFRGLADTPSDLVFASFPHQTGLARSQSLRACRWCLIV